MYKKQHITNSLKKSVLNTNSSMICAQYYARQLL